MSPNPEGSKELKDYVGRSRMEAARVSHQAWLPPCLRVGKGVSAGAWPPMAGGGQGCWWLLWPLWILLLSIALFEKDFNCES